MNKEKQNEEKKIDKVNLRETFFELLQEEKEEEEKIDLIKDVLETDEVSDTAKKIKEKNENSNEKTVTDNELSLFIENELNNNEETMTLKIFLDTDKELNDIIKENKFPTFEEIMRLKMLYKTITLVQIGTHLEYLALKKPPKYFIIKELKSKEKYSITEKYEDDKYMYFSEILKKCILFPSVTQDDIDELPDGIFEFLISTIFSYSDMTKNTTKIIKRIK